MATSSAPVPATRPRVLIAEDQPDVIEAIRMVLKQEGYDTTSANSPKAVMEALAVDKFDLLLMDLNYTRDTTSGTEGLDLLAQVQGAEPRLPVIVMTAWGSVELAVEAMRRGAVDFIQKPWDNWRLIGMVRNQMERRREIRKAESDADREMREAGEIQKRLMPKHITQIPGTDIAVDWKPARTLGGDYFDVLRFSDGSVGLCIADVEGKGVPAALVMSNLQSAVKAFASSSVEPRALCQRMNAIFCEDVQTERSISLFYGRLDPTTRRLTYTNAGHCPPLLIHRDGRQEKLEVGGALLGRLSYWKYEQAEITLEAGDFLLMYTDGMTEAENGNEEEYGEDRMAACALASGQITADALQRKLFAEVAAYCGNRFHDDATLMVLGMQ
jgi:phosphoserine phosphatase RsbU/P